RQVLLDGVAVLDLDVAGERPDPQLAVLDGDEVELFDRVDVHQGARLGEPEAHQRDQAVAAGQHLGVLAEALQQLGGLLNGGCPLVLESSWDHAFAPPPLAEVEDRPRASLICFHKRSGLAGMSTCVIPNGVRASVMALMTDALEAMVAASPVYFTPR